MTMSLKKISSDTVIDPTARIMDFVNLYGCEIGAETLVGTFVEVQRGATIGARCKIQSHTFICTGVIIEDGVFVGHGVVFINDNYPQATRKDGAPEQAEDWQGRFKETRVCKGASIGSGAVVLGGVVIGEGAVVGAGAVVTKNVDPRTVVVGNPAQFLRTL